MLSAFTVQVLVERLLQQNVHKLCNSTNLTRRAYDSHGMSMIKSGLGNVETLFT
jgi:hypothetical protein